MGSEMCIRDSYSSKKMGMWNLTHTQKEVVPKKKTLFLIEKYIEDARQDEKHLPDLLEAIMRPTDPVKEELWQKWFKIDQFWGSKITKMMV